MNQKDALNPGFPQQNIQPRLAHGKTWIYIDMHADEIVKVLYNAKLTYDKQKQMIFVSDGNGEQFALTRNNYLLGKDGNVYKAISRKNLRLMYTYDPSRWIYVFENRNRAQERDAPYKIMTNALLDFNKDVCRGIYQILSCDVNDPKKAERTHRLFKGTSYYIDIWQKNTYRFEKKEATLYDENGEDIWKFAINRPPSFPQKNKNI
jgi:hypothetical protein